MISSSQSSGIKRVSNVCSKPFYKSEFWETSLAVQWIRLHASTAGGVSSIPGRGTKTLMPHGVVPRKNKVRVLGMPFLCPACQISLILVLCQSMPSIRACTTYILSSSPSHQPPVYSIHLEAYSVTISYFTRTTRLRSIIDIQVFKAKNQKHY